MATASWHFYRERVPLRAKLGKRTTALQPSPQDPSNQRHQSSQGTRPSTTSMYQREWRLWKDANLPLSRQCALSSSLFFFGLGIETLLAVESIRCCSFEENAPMQSGCTFRLLTMTSTTDFSPSTCHAFLNSAA